MALKTIFVLTEHFQVMGSAMTLLTLRQRRRMLTAMAVYTGKGTMPTCRFGDFLRRLNMTRLTEPPRSVSWR